MSCPICGRSDYQSYLGKFGTYLIFRCKWCGYQYYGDYLRNEVEPDYNQKVVSKSEWGSFRHDGDIDMKVLRKRAEGAVRYFNDGRPRVEMQTHIFGYPFSIIDNGKLSDNEKAYKGNVIIRSLSYHEKGVYAGKVTMAYDDDYNDGRGQGGSGGILVDDVKSVTIQGSYLVISGRNGKDEITFRYLIQDQPDAKPFTKPVAKQKPVSKPEPKKEIPKPEPRKEPPKPKKEPKQMPKKAPEPKKPMITRPSKKKGKAELVYEVRVDGRVEGTFSSKAKAESMKRDLKSRGFKPKVCGVFQ